MKCNFFQLFLIFLFPNWIISQSVAQGFYMNTNGGYSIKMSSQNLSGFINVDSYVTSDNIIISTIEQLYVSLGKGFNGEISLGYMFNKNIGTELGFSYLFGDKTTAKYKGNYSYIAYSISSKMFRITPLVVLSTDFDKINPYVKLGIIVGYGYILYEYENSYYDNSEILIQEAKLKGGIPIGASSKFGVKFNISNKLSLFGEFCFINLSYTPTKGKLIKYLHNGIDKLPDLSQRDKEVEFEDEYTFSSNTTAPNSILYKLKQTFPFGSVGLNVGINIKL